MQKQRVHSIARAWVGAAGLALLLAGCESGGGGTTSGLSSFIGGGGGSSGIIVVAGSDVGSGAGDISSVATVANPEPGSLALFGVGLAGLALGRRRRARQS